MLKFSYIEPLRAAGLDSPFNNQTISASKRCFQMDKSRQCDWLQVIPNTPTEIYDYSFFLVLTHFRCIMHAYLRSLSIL